MEPERAGAVGSVHAGLWACDGSACGWGSVGVYVGSVSGGGTVVVVSLVVKVVHGDVVRAVVVAVAT